MLSIVDIKRELGKNILIYPLNVSSIKSNSIDLHASKFAWSISTKKPLFDGTDSIVIPPHDTALIYSEEAIYVSNKIGGTYHSKVKLVSIGLGHIGTSLDAQYIGLSVVALHNISDDPKKVIVGSEFVTIMFHYLHSDDYVDTVSHDNPPGHPSLVSNYEGYDVFQQWIESNRWCRSKSELYTQIVNSAEFKDCKKQFRQEQIRFNRKIWKRKGLKYFCLVGGWLALNVLLSLPAYSFQWGNISALSAAIIENFSVPLLLSLIVPNIVLDFTDS